MTESSKENKREEALFKSLSAYKRAEPDKELFGKITASLNSSKSLKLNNISLRVAAIAAILVLCVNVVAIQKIALSEETSEGSASVEGLINDYSIYDYE